MGNLYTNDKVLSYDATADQYATHVPDAVEVIRQSLYDTATYLAAGQTELLFFQQPKGQNGKTIADTNMEIAGSLPAGKSFLIEGIGIHLFPTANPSGVAATTNFLNDIYTFAKGGNLNLFISSKSYLEESPLVCFPPQTGISNNPAVSTTVAATSMNSDNASLAGQVYMLSPTPLMLVPTTNFSVGLRWPAALPLPSTQNMKVVVKLYGVMYRWVQ